jgi:hypothetical protein
MYVLILVIAMEQPGTGTSVAATSQIIGKFNSLDACKAAASKPHAEGAVPDLSPPVSWGASWYCTYTGAPWRLAPTRGSSSAAR